MMMNDHLLRDLFARSDGDTLPEFPPNYPPQSAWRNFRGRTDILSLWRDSLSTFRNEPVVYVHFPFCPSECHFCGFYKKALAGTGEIEAFLKAFQAEASFFHPVFGKTPLRYFCIGGGTPSIMSEAQLEKFFAIAYSNFRITRKTKIALEASPSTLTRSKLRLLADNDVHWLSIGVQSFDEGLMRKHNRPQSRKQAVEAILSAKKEGIQQVEVDLMCGLQGQSYAGFLDDVRQTAKLDVERVYIFDYQPRANCLSDKKEGSLPGDLREDARRFRRKAFEILTDSGYTMRCGHWVYKRRGSEWPYSYDQGEEGSYSILGLGPSAVSYAVGKARYQNSASETAYEKSLSAGKAPIADFAELDAKDEMINFILLESSHRGRIPKGKFRKRFGKDVEDVFPRQMRSLVKKGVFADIAGDFVLLEKETASFEIRKAFFEKDIIAALAKRYAPKGKPSMPPDIPKTPHHPLFNRLSGNTFEARLADRCGLDCLFCPNSLKDRPVDRDLVAREMYRAKKSYENILFGGGEPTASAHVEFFLNLARKIGFKRRTLLTNAMKLADLPYCRRLGKSGLTSAIIKTASADNRINSKLFRNGEQLGRSLTAAGHLKGLGIDVAACVILTGLNIKKLGETLSLFKAEGVRSFILWFPRYLGNMKTNSEKDPALDLRYGEAVQSVQGLPDRILKGISLRTLNIPLCVLSPKHKMAADVLGDKDEGDARETYYGDELIKMNFEYECRYLLNCAGASSDYLRKFGFDEIKPIK